MYLASANLQRFAQKQEDLYNFRCPYCGDSKKNKIKSRGYIYRKQNDYFYRCHNCGIGTTFSNFLEHINSTLHRDYVLERFCSKEKKQTNSNSLNLPIGPSASSRFLQTKKTIYNVDIKSINDLPVDHYASSYILNRKIPKKFWSEIFFTKDFKFFMDREFPNHGKKLFEEDERIILFYTNKDGVITNVAGRSLTSLGHRYITVKVTEDKKIFGLHRINTDETVYITEGQLDSLFIHNCVACGDSSLNRLSDYLKEQYGVKNTVLIYDNEPRNKEIVKSIQKSIEDGHSVCLLPQQYKKDINEIVISNKLTEDQLSDIINENTFCGLEAELKFMEWRQI